MKPYYNIACAYIYVAQKNSFYAYILAQYCRIVNRYCETKAFKTIDKEFESFVRLCGYNNAYELLNKSYMLAYYLFTHPVNTDVDLLSSLAIYNKLT